MSEGRMAAIAVISNAVLGWLLITTAVAGEISSEVREQAMATVVVYGAQKAAVLSCLTHDPAVGIDMGQVFGEDEAHTRASWLSSGGTTEEWSRFEGAFSQTADVPQDQCAKILDDLYLMKPSGRLLSMRSPFQEMSDRPSF